MTALVTPGRPTTALTSPASRRAWLKGFGSLLGTSLLAVPGTLLAHPAVGDAAPATNGRPAAPATADAASDLVGGDEFIGMVKLVTGTDVPPGWALCDGRELLVADHPALFALLRTTYGGDGRRTFALPDMRADMANLASLAATQGADGAPLGRLCVVKLRNAPALTTAVTELRLIHLRQSRPAVV